MPVALAEENPPYAERSTTDAAELEEWVRLGYLVDIGRCADEIMQEVQDVDLLALEFNHDERLERNSGRHPKLIQRVMGGEDTCRTAMPRTSSARSSRLRPMADRKCWCRCI